MPAEVMLAVLPPIPLCFQSKYFVVVLCCFLKEQDAAGALSEVMALTELLIECCARLWSGKNGSGQGAPFALRCVVSVCVDEIRGLALKVLL